MWVLLFVLTEFRSLSQRGETRGEKPAINSGPGQRVPPARRRGAASYTQPSEDTQAH